ncbi:MULTISPECIES: Gfo/Idh/MocA family protein [Streptomyces]|uniref:Oxidoreductase domain-containing protein n=1 Tax=Streptomyces albus (strain ATCC 21838 / DSM 41398 / FERM P-419 / JCM 4703 / NBRC 107858) TaxID=1081613 RepID=A0A0B5F7Q6_STRA4|nr:Gfo/Idh/MocA family oxidoreductase [Streptomyces sp. SCSIO ZS0520]AJE87600.1 oxidoreductase domain-containing protein [Streptomyces albus]AOU81901.1 oxidoreductase domain-containing protein [Streptomyces albus]AYN37586.1 gfo/Idh/MocA family oxidoreductase [Streptomyces albus]
MTVPSPAPADPSTRELRLAVVGLGLRATLAKEAHRPGAGAAVVAAADTDPGSHPRAREWFGDGVRLYGGHRELLAGEDLDAVFVITPDHTHEAIVTDLLDAGVAVFVEKPLAITTEGCDRVLAAARRGGARLYVGHNMRHMPVVRVMRELIRRGEIGEVKAVWCRHFVGHGGDFYFKDWHADRRNTTGLLLQKGAHDLDVIHWLAGGYTEHVTALGALTLYGDIADRSGQRPGAVMPDWYDPERNWPPLSLTGLNPVVDVEDLSMMTMRLQNGVHASYQQCHYTPDYWRNYTVIGTEGRLENFGDHGESAEVRVWQRRSGYRADADLVVPMPTAAGGHGGADPLLVEEFLRFVRVGGETDTSPIAAREAVAAGCAATESLRNDGRPVRVDRVAPELARWFEEGQV